MGTHPRPEGDPDDLSVRLRAGTADIHRQAEQRPFMQAFFAGQLSRQGYTAWLARQWHIYRVLEQALTGHRVDPRIAGVVPTELHRTTRIEADLDYLTDGGWRNGDHLTEATRRYVDRITTNADAFVPGLLAHAWLRYLGNVGGQQILRRLVTAAIGLSDDGSGLAFTDYTGIGDVRAFFRGFHAGLDAVALTPEDKDRVVVEATIGFRLNIALTDELAADLGLSDPVPGASLRTAHPN